MEGKKRRKKDRKKDKGRQRERRSLSIKAGMYKEVETEIETG